jgi:tripartite-type tricarboxylate transporter receptor subunit TctC
MHPLIGQVLCLVVGTACLVGAAPARAQAYPTKPVTVIVPFTPGGSSDATMRAMSGKLGELLGKPLVLDNKPGANGTLGASMVARAAPDGYTLLIGSIGTYAITPSLLKTLPYDTVKDLEPLTLAVRTPNLIVVTPSFPANTVGELIAYMKKNPGKVTFASSGIGSTDHLTSVLFWQKTGTQGTHVPYKGGGAAITDVMAGHADVLITNLGVLSGHAKAGKLKALAVTASKRANDLPQVPTLAEAGVKDLDVYSWQGISAPRGLSREVSVKLHAALVQTLQDKGVRSSLEATGFEVVGSTAAQFAEQLAAETARWKAVIDSAGIKAE